LIERELRLLVEEGAIREVIVVRRASGTYVITVNGRTLKSARREERFFARLDTAAELLHKFGIERFVVLRQDNDNKAGDAGGGLPAALTAKAVFVG